MPENAPEPGVGDSTCPDWLNPIAAEMWDRYAAEMERIGMLSIIDRELLEAYCAAYGRMRRAHEAMDEAEDVKIESLWARAARQEATLMKTMASEMGLTQTSRGRVSVTKPDEKDELEDFLSRGS